MPTKKGKAEAAAEEAGHKVVKAPLEDHALLQLNAHLCEAAVSAENRTAAAAVRSSTLIAAKVPLVRCVVNNITLDVAANRAIGAFGADALCAAVGKPAGAPIRVLTHCNTGSLATAGYGTALGVVRSLRESGRLEHIYCNETRPYNQGARLTAYEIAFEKMPGTLICDSAAASLCSSSRADPSPEPGRIPGGVPREPGRCERPEPGRRRASSPGGANASRSASSGGVPGPRSTPRGDAARGALTSAGKGSAAGRLANRTSSSFCCALCASAACALCACAACARRGASISPVSSSRGGSAAPGATACAANPAPGGPASGGPARIDRFGKRRGQNARTTNVRRM